MFQFNLLQTRARSTDQQQGAPVMSLLQYFQKASVSNESAAKNLRLPSTNAMGLSSEEQSNVTSEINNAASINNKRKRVTYKEEDTHVRLPNTPITAERRMP